jgi:hypothetical protein
MVMTHCHASSQLNLDFNVATKLCLLKRALLDNRFVYMN